MSESICWQKIIVFSCELIPKSSPNLSPVGSVLPKEAILSWIDPLQSSNHGRVYGPSWSKVLCMGTPNKCPLQQILSPRRNNDLSVIPCSKSASSSPNCFYVPTYLCQTLAPPIYVRHYHLPSSSLKNVLKRLTTQR